MDIGKQIARYRKEKHITQEQFGEAVGVTNRTVSKWESGVSLPGVDLIPQIASALGVSLDQLFGEKTKEESKELSQIIKEAVLSVVNESLTDTLREVLEDVLPDCINNYRSADEYSLLILGREKSSICQFRGQGSVQGPLTQNNNKYAVVIPAPGGNVIVGYYDSKEEASAALEVIYKAYSQKMKKIELL